MAGCLIVNFISPAFSKISNVAFTERLSVIIKVSRLPNFLASGVKNSSAQDRPALKLRSDKSIPYLISRVFYFYDNYVMLAWRKKYLYGN